MWAHLTWTDNSQNLHFLAIFGHFGPPFRPPFWPLFGPFLTPLLDPPDPPGGAKFIDISPPWILGPACTLTEPPVSPVGHCQNKSGIHLVRRRSVHCRSSRCTRIPFSLHDKNFFLFLLRPSARYLSHSVEEKTETVFDEGSGSFYIKLKYYILNLIYKGS